MGDRPNAMNSIFEARPVNRASQKAPTGKSNKIKSRHTISLESFGRIANGMSKIFDCGK